MPQVLKLNTLEFNRRMLLNHQIYRHPSSNQWVTFVHGAGGSSAIWYKQIKAFKERFNVLLVDLRGHGKNKVEQETVHHYTFNLVTDDLKLLLDHLAIKNAHFIGISLGTIIIRNLSIRYPEMINSMVLGGAIVDLDLRTSFLLTIGRLIRFVAPYLWLYKLFALIIMPRKNHRAARRLFIREAKRLNQKEFLRWFKLAAKLGNVLKSLKNKTVEMKTLYIMGVQDHLFIDSVRKIVSTSSNAELLLVDGAGHVVNIDQPITFNREVISFILKSA